MNRKNNTIQLFNRFEFGPRTIVSVIFAAGLYLGMYFAVKYDNVLVSLFSILSAVSISFFGRFLSACIPLLIALILIFYSFPIALLPLCFFKAFCFAYFSSSCILFFKNAGWLIRFFLLFSDTCSLLLLLWFCLRHADGSTHLLKRDFAFCCVILIFICCFDCFSVSPFLMMLVNY